MFSFFFMLQNMTQRITINEFASHGSLRITQPQHCLVGCGPAHNRFPGLNNFDLGMHFMKEGVYRPFLLYADFSVL